MGVSNYTEVDVREASRAFTGWTIQPKLPRQPFGRFPWSFEFRPEDHDDGEKTFLGQTGNFDGEDIIDIIVKEPATARFICRHLYSFFVADEVQVPAWTIEPARDEEALGMMIDALYPGQAGVGHPVCHEVDAGQQGTAVDPLRAGVPSFNAGGV